MTLPEFTPTGDLPEGLHRASLREVVEHFGGDLQPRQQATRTLQHIHEILQPTGQLRRLVVFGSYVTAKAEPNDIDLILVMADGFDPTQFDEEVQSIFDHHTATERWGASIFWLCSSSILLGSVDDCIASWQRKRDLTLRGIVEVVE